MAMEDPPEEPRSMPAWVMTFADLMSLLMCFFVLLLSFAEIDATKFKQIAESLEKAFGVQREVPAMEIPMGTSPVFDHFSPGRPEPTLLDEVRQQTQQDDPRLRTHTAQVLAQVEQQTQQQVERTAAQVAQQLAAEIQAGKLQLQQEEDRIIIRIEERGSFGSGASQLSPEFTEILGRIGDTLAQVPGKIAIEGHTDNIPMRSARYASNWDLSAARAAAVANALLAKGAVQQERLRISGLAETRPVLDNATPEHRAQNRRVEIVVDLEQPIAAYQAKVLSLLEQGRAQEAFQLGWQ
ncbi:type VI secretion system protein TssL, long form [Serpentinimonas barnesii]|uniref:type VI secretion system protein TssL, long form n=1 Tax=Serpentinimonas barnesii TaxID=1458427 RepID=UPI000AC32949|nr:type VI secretion system protein TssL, long form [Serpentinimonas barnesii]